ncbi:MAG: outer membrane beta-barrel protein [Bacteroidales bacterium]|nr:outer membrane beta-barrel protein [Bacteroidales bacterium]MCL2133881.1 outer membrane beta-barrel protein [Bacteroidales bacterium]
MKKLIILFAVVALTISATNAQDFKPFRVDLGGGYALPFTNPYKGGFGFYLEPKYEVQPQLAIGLRLEALFFGGSDVEGQSAGIKLSSGYMATGDYYLNNESFRPFVGLGLGIFRTGAIEINSSALEGSSGTNFSAMARAGFDFYHFRLAASYNAAFAEKMFHYLALNIGFYIGGGKN